MLFAVSVVFSHDFIAVQKALNLTMRLSKFHVLESHELSGSDDDDAAIGNESLAQYPAVLTLVPGT